MVADIQSVDGSEKLLSQIKEATTVEDWSFILADYISWGNNKISNNTAIFNMNSAHDCPNRESENCQVPWESCYAGKAERQYPNTLPYRRRQEYLRDCLDADTFAKAFLQIVERKRNPVKALRLSEAGDFRHNGDIYWADRIAKHLTEHGISVYTYSASDYLEGWDSVEYLVVNQSNDKREYGDRRFKAFHGEKPEGFVWCPNDYHKQQGGDVKEAPKCGECTLCLKKEGPDVAIPLH